MPFTPDQPTSFKADNGNASGNQTIASLGESKTAQLPPGNFQPDVSAAEPGFVEKGLDFIPGMKQRREKIANYRATPQYQTSHPQPETGMNDPAYTAMGLASEAPIWALGKFIPGMKSLVKPGAERAAVMDLVKNEEKLGPAVSQKIGEATEQFNKTQIAPRMLEQQARASEQAVPFNPGEFTGIHPKIDQMVEQLGSGGVKEIPMKDALALRAALNDKSLFRDLGPYSPDIAAKSQKAVEAGNKLRAVLGETDPNIAALSGELQDAYKLRNAVTSSAAKRPIGTVEARTGSDKASLLSQFDTAAGTDLRGLGKNISTANERLGATPGFAVPTSTNAALQKLLGIAPRAKDAASQAILKQIEQNPNLLKIIPASPNAKRFDSGE